MTLQPTTTQQATAYMNESQPGWGLGLVVEDQPDNWVLVFEHAGRKKFIKGKAKTLVVVTVPREGLDKLRARLSGKQTARSGGKPTPRARSPRRTARASA